MIRSYLNSNVTGELLFVNSVDCVRVGSDTKGAPFIKCCVLRFLNSLAHDLL
jgi:hypothetical protein